MRYSVSILAVAALAACQAGGPNMDDTDGMLDECRAEANQWMVGRDLASVTMPADLEARIIGPDTMVTMDYDPLRTNIYVDDAGTITRAQCG